MLNTDSDAHARRHQEIGQQPICSKHCKIGPGLTKTSDQEIDHYVRSIVSLSFHPPAPAGWFADDEDAVVDAKCRVFGVEGLRVVDGSSSPSPSAATSMLIMAAEKIAAGMYDLRPARAVRRRRRHGSGCRRQHRLRGRGQDRADRDQAAAEAQRADPRADRRAGADHRPLRPRSLCRRRRSFRAGQIILQRRGRRRKPDGEPRGDGGLCATR